MTTIVILLLGLGTVLILSAIETDPSTGQSVSVLKTVQNIWNDVPPNFSQSTSQGTTAANTAGAQGISGVPANVTPSTATGSGQVQSTQYANQMQQYGQNMS